MQETHYLSTSIKNDIFFLIDASASMGVADMRDGGTRLEAAKEITEEVIRRLQGQNISLSIFTSELTTLSPLTYDYIYTRIMLRNIGINANDVPGTDIARTLETFRKIALETPNDNPKTLILLTDGEETTFDTPSEDRALAEKLLHAIGDVKKSNLNILCVGLGTKKGGWVPDVVYEGKNVRSSLNERPLQLFVQLCKGRYFSAIDHSTLALAEALVDTLYGDREKVSPEMRREFSSSHLEGLPLDGRELFQIPLALSLIFLLLYASLNRLWSRNILCIALFGSIFLLPAHSFPSDTVLEHVEKEAILPALEKEVELALSSLEIFEGAVYDRTSEQALLQHMVSLYKPQKALWERWMEEQSAHEQHISSLSQEALRLYASALDAMEQGDHILAKQEFYHLRELFHKVRENKQNTGAAQQQMSSMSMHTKTTPEMQRALELYQQMEAEDAALKVPHTASRDGIKPW